MSTESLAARASSTPGATAQVHAQRWPAQSWLSAALLTGWAGVVATYTWEFFVGLELGAAVFAVVGTGLLALLARAIAPPLARYGVWLALAFGSLLGAFVASTYSLFVGLVPEAILLHGMVVLFATGVGLAALGLVPIRWPGVWPRALVALVGGVVLGELWTRLMTTRGSIELLRELEASVLFERLLAGAFLAITLLFGARQLSAEARRAESNDDPRTRSTAVRAILVATGFLAFCGSIVLLLGSAGGQDDE